MLLLNFIVMQQTQKKIQFQFQILYFDYKMLLIIRENKSLTLYSIAKEHKSSEKDVKLTEK